MACRLVINKWGERMLLDEFLRIVGEMSRREQILIANASKIKLRRLKRIIRDAGMNADLAEIIRLFDVFGSEVDIQLTKTGLMKCSNEKEQAIINKPNGD